MIEYCTKCKKPTKYTKINGWLKGKHFFIWYCENCINKEMANFLNDIIEKLNKNE